VKFLILILCLLTAQPIAWARDCSYDLTGKPAYGEAQKLGLELTTKDDLVIERRGSPGRFVYYDGDGQRITSSAKIRTLEAMKIRPDLTSVRMVDSPNYHLLAIGRDAGGKSQYVYNPLWQQISGDIKFESLLEFGQVLPAIRAQVKKDMRDKEDARKRLLALLVRILDLTGMRVGNELSTEDGVFGLTTLRKQHVTVEGTKVTFRFKGKKGMPNVFQLSDAAVASMVNEMLEQRGWDLFKYKTNDGFKTLRSLDVNKYIKELSGQEFTAKTFRSWKANTAAVEFLSGQALPATEKDQRGLHRALNESIADLLNNTPNITKSHYIDPHVFQVFVASNGFRGFFSRAARRNRKSRSLLEEATLLILMSDLP
jgi:DNA topoisomerase-1